MENQLENQNNIELSQFTNLTLEQLREKMDRKKRGRYNGEQEQDINVVNYPEKKKLTLKDWENKLLQIISSISTQKGYTWQWTDENRLVIRMLFDYFTRHDKSELDHRKGIYLYGPPGTGKSEIMNIFARFSVVWASEFPLSVAYRTIIFPKMCSDIETSQSKAIIKDRGLYTDAVCLQDVFAEEIVNYWGKPYNVLEDVLHYRTDARLTTHATSNVKPDDFEKEAIRARHRSSTISRFYGLWNFVELKGKDFRK